MVDVVGHAPAMSRSPKLSAPNLVIHFADEVSGEKLADLVTALKESKRPDAPTALVVSAKPSRIERLPYSEIVTYAEDDGKLRRHYGVTFGGAATVVVDPSGKVIWKGEGPIDSRELSSVLGKVLVKAPAPKATLLSAGARMDQRAPNFLFEASPGQPLTLRKVARRKVVLVFFNQSSPASIAAVREAANAHDGKTLVLAISDGHTPTSSDLAPAIVVPDLKREIARAYGVTMWPTIVAIDESGIIRSIGYGRSIPTEGKKGA